MSSNSSNTQASILLVDNDEPIRNTVADLLRRAGYKVTSASDGLEALARVAESTPDLILTDVMMPKMGGIELIKRLRTEPPTKAIRVIMFMAEGTTEDFISGLDFDADDYLPKPLEMEVVLARVYAQVNLLYGKTKWPPTALLARMHVKADVISAETNWPSTALLARMHTKSERPPLPSLSTQIRQTGLVSQRLFATVARREIQRAASGEAPGCMAYLALAELEYLQERFGTLVEAEIAKQIASLVVQSPRPLALSNGSFALLLPETSPEDAEQSLQLLADQIMAHTFTSHGAKLHLTPIIGFAAFSEGKDFTALRGEALAALDFAATQLDLVPKRYEPNMKHYRRRTVDRFRRRWSSTFQFVLMVILGWIIPYNIYAWFDFIGHDITSVLYIIIVIALAVTAFLIWLEGVFALKVLHPPDPPRQPFPPASAIIAAYLPNEASTIIETVKAFLRLEYPAPLQIILAYNTTKDLPIEILLRQMAKHDSRFQLLRVKESISKAQNVNTALAEVSGEFVGIFDADHHPQPQNFIRAWRWLSNGYDVVQGHCQVRNGAESWVAQMVAVEFEAMYAVSHPGRARLYNFGIFGGSNGFWKTELLRQTRLRGFMLTEDIDSSIRITEDGYKIVSDPLLISQELAPLTLGALWNQRMRWAQGWYQVSTLYFFKALLSRKLSLRQKSGILWLLGWRELYPWLAVQMVPLVAYWVVKYGGLDKLDWLIPIFVLTTLFTLSVGPGQTLFAYLLAAPEVRRHKRWFFHYFLRSILFYSEFKNTIGRIAQFKEIMGEKQWKITPRANAGSTKSDVR